MEYERSSIFCIFISCIKLLDAKVDDRWLVSVNDIADDTKRRLKECSRLRIIIAILARHIENMKILEYIKYEPSHYACCWHIFLSFYSSRTPLPCSVFHLSNNAFLSNAWALIANQIEYMALNSLRILCMAYDYKTGYDVSVSDSIYSILLASFPLLFALPIGYLRDIARIHPVCMFACVSQ